MPGTELPADRARRCEAHAEECRTLADTFRDPCQRGSMLDIARTWEMLAATAARRACDAETAAVRCRIPD